jgi:fatty acid desaturase
MNATSYVRRIAVFFCLAMVLLAALTPGAAGFLPAILVPMWFFIAIVLSFLLSYVDEQHHTQQALALPAFSPRPPPEL